MVLWLGCPASAPVLSPYLFAHPNTHTPGPLERHRLIKITINVSLVARSIVITDVAGIFGFTPTPRDPTIDTTGGQNDIQ